MTSILAADFFHNKLFAQALQGSHTKHSSSRAFTLVVLVLLLAYGAAMSMYYSVLYSPLYADVDSDGGIFGIVANILSSPFRPPRYRET